MDNLTHSLVGVAVAKAGLERLSPWALGTCVIAANAPDIDIVSLAGGRWNYLHHHRGITHSIAGTLALAVLIPLACYLIEHTVARLRHKPARTRLPGLLVASLIAAATHPILDWTNSYGWRPFLPWNPTWFYGDLVFIVDLWLWLALGGACFLLTARRGWRLGAWLFLATVLTLAIIWVGPGRFDRTQLYVVLTLWTGGLLGFALLYRRGFATRYGRAIAIVALAQIVVYWGALAVLHHVALERAAAFAAREAASRGEAVVDVAAMPAFSDPLRWDCIFVTHPATYRFNLSLNGVGDVSITRVARYENPPPGDTAVVAAAERDDRARIFLGFARFPVIRVEGDCATQLLVQFADLRYTEPGAPTRGTFALELPVDCSGGGATNAK